MTTPSDTQSLILSRAATRPGNLALPLPEGLVGAAAKMVVGKMIARGWLEEVEANLRRGEPMWRETGDGHGTTLIATEAGLEAVGIEPVHCHAPASRGCDGSRDGRGLRMAGPYRPRLHLGGAEEEAGSAHHRREGRG